MTTIANIAQRLLDENNFVIDSSSANFTAQNILDENNYTTSEISLANTEQLIDNSINYVNLQTNSSIAAMAGSAGSKTGTATRTQTVIIKALATLMIRAYLDRGPQVSLSGLSVSAVISDPQYSLYAETIKSGIAKLYALSKENVEYLIDNAIDYISLRTGEVITHLSGSAGSKSLTATDSQIIVIKSLSSLLLRDSIDLGQHVTADNVSVTNILSDQKYKSLSQMVENGITMLTTGTYTMKKLQAIYNLRHASS